MSRPPRIVRLLVCALPYLVLACGSDPRGRLEAVPELNPSELPGSAAVMLADWKQRLRGLLDDPDANAQELAEAFGRVGQMAHAAQRVDTAAACYRNARHLSPTERRWPYYLGQLHHFAGEWDRSAENFERALELSPDDLPTLIALGQLYVDRGEIGRAEELFLRAVEQDDPSAAGLFGLGLVRAAEGEFPAAVQHFEEVLARVPQANRIHYHLGVVYGRMGDRERAESHMARQGAGLPQPADRLMDEIQALRQAVEERVVPATAALREGRLDDALVELRAAEASDPDDPLVQLRLGETLARTGQLEQAEPHYRAALRLDTDRRVVQSASLDLARILVATGRRSEALEHFTRAIELDPEAEPADRARHGLVRALVTLGRPQEGETHFRRLLQSGAQEPPLYVSLAEMLGETGAYTSARWVFDRGREAHPRDALIANSMARFLSTCPDDATRDGAEALRLASSLFAAAKSGPHAVTLAMALAENGRFDEAVEVQRAAIAEAERAVSTEIVGQLRRQLELYEAGKPLRREPPRPQK